MQTVKRSMMRILYVCGIASALIVVDVSTSLNPLTSANDVKIE
jgi:hypothetical protein